MSDAPAPSKPKANSYYYWHGHEKERAAVGDVAPMPTPQLVKRDEDAARSPLSEVPPAPVSKYGWADGAKSVSVYVDALAKPGGVAAAGEEKLVEQSVDIAFRRNGFQLYFATTVVATGALRRKVMALQLSHKINPDACTFKVKPAAQQIHLKLVKAKEETWYDLEGNASDRDDDVDEDAEKSENGSDDA